MHFAFIFNHRAFSKNRRWLTFLFGKPLRPFHKILLTMEHSTNRKRSLNKKKLFYRYFADIMRIRNNIIREVLPCEDGLFFFLH